jgi:hypothetical protein
MRRIPLAAAFTGLLPVLVSFADDPAGTWLSEPRAEIKIIVGKDGSRVIGPGWQHVFETGATILNFEVAPGRRMTLRREGNRWVGEYLHPRVRPGTHEFETHIMIFSRQSGETE